MLIALCIMWGITWPIMRIALREVPPFTMRTTSALVGGVILFAACFVLRRSLRLSRPQSLRPCIRRFNSQRRELQHFLDLCPTRRGDIAGGGAVVLDADLGGRAELDFSPRAADRHAADCHRLVRRRPRRPDLSAGRNGNSAWYLVGARHRHKLGGRHGLFEMGAARGRPHGGCNLAGRRLVFYHWRMHADLRARPRFSCRACRRGDCHGTLRRAWHRHRLRTLVFDYHEASRHDGVARRARQSGDRRHLFGSDPWRAPDRPPMPSDLR